MILELQANSQLNQGRTPEWIRVELYDRAANGIQELTMDIKGETTHKPNNFQTHTKGWLKPRSYRKDDEFIELENIHKHNIIDYDLLFVDMIRKADAIVVGIYSTDNINHNAKGILTGGIGRYWHSGMGVYVEFKFKYEINL